ncbi:MAG: choice-of-anchor D domain-containing protein, partial [Planctomycetota bacterium]
MKQITICSLALAMLAFVGCERKSTGGGTDTRIQVAYGDQIVQKGSDPSEAAGTAFGALPTSWPVPARHEFTISNPSAVSVTLGQISVESNLQDGEEPSFTVEQSERTNLAANDGQGVTFDLLFDPVSDGPKTATITIPYVGAGDDEQSSFQFSVSGTGGNASGLDPVLILGFDGQAIENGSVTPTTESGTDFGELSLSATPKVRTFSILNTSSEQVVLQEGSLVLTGEDAFSLTEWSDERQVLGQEDSADFSIAFDPESQQEFLGSVELTYKLGDDYGTYTFDIVGTGIVGADDREVGVYGGSPNDLKEIPDGTITTSVEQGTDFGAF